MRKPYHLKSDQEPTDKELGELMRSVLKDVKARAKAADQKFQALHLAQIKTALEQRKQTKLPKAKHERA
jgi:hypothetical protein